MVILKFDNTYLNSEGSISFLCQIVESRLESQPVVIVPALPNVNNLFLDKRLSEVKRIHQDLIARLFGNKEIVEDAYNYIDKIIIKAATGGRNSLFLGEALSSYIVSIALNYYGLRAKQIESKINMDLEPVFKKGFIPVVPVSMVAALKSQTTANLH